MNKTSDQYTNILHKADGISSIDDEYRNFTAAEKMKWTKNKIMNGIEKLLGQMFFFFQITIATSQAIVLFHSVSTHHRKHRLDWF